MGKIEIFLILPGFRKHPEECDTRVLTGTDWESVNYKLQELVCEEDEITGSLYPINCIVHIGYSDWPPSRGLRSL